MSDPRIVRTPGIVGGAARIEGTRVRTFNVLAGHLSGWSTDVIANEYRLTQAQVAAALRYELRLHRRLGRWLRSWLPSVTGEIEWRGRTWEV